MTPDVSSVLAAAGRHDTSGGYECTSDAIADCPALQQAAEQACYRYCRRVLDEIWGYGVGEQPRRVYIERARLEQLIAASA